MTYLPRLTVRSDWVNTMTLDFGKQYGPMPLGAWVAVVGTGVGIAVYSNRNGGTVDDSYERDTAIDPGVGEGGGGEWIDLEPPPDETTSGEPQDNDEWGRQAVNHLIARGYDPAISDQAIRKYLASERLTLQESALVSKALFALGAPPYPLPPGPRIPTIPRPPIPPRRRRRRRRPNRDRTPDRKRKRGTPPNRKGIRYHVVKPGNTLSGLAQRYYGNARAYDRIYNANRHGRKRADGTPGMIRNPNRINVGWKLIIPR